MEITCKTNFTIGSVGSPTWLHELQKCVNGDSKLAVNLPMSAVQEHKNQNDIFYSHQCNELYPQRVCDVCCSLLKVDFKFINENELRCEGYIKLNA